ncbi:unnamed protein product [Ectocarpus sp. 4 AP-2014]
MDDLSEGNLWRVIEHSTKFEARKKSTRAIEYSTWAHGIQLLLSMSKEEDICAVLRGAQRPTSESPITSSNSVGGGGVDDDEGGGDNNDGGKKEGAMTAARWQRASSRLHGVLCLTTTGIPQGLVKRHGGNHRAGGNGNGPNGQAAWREGHVRLSASHPRSFKQHPNVCRARPGRVLEHTASASHGPAEGARRSCFR